MNVFWGSNGAGKTSILESIHCLATSRSFRSRKHTGLVSLDADQFLLFGRYLRAHQGNQPGADATKDALGRVGIQRHRSGDPVIKKDGERVLRLSDLSQEFPVLVLNSDSFDMLLGGPAKRRQLIDWCLFHVKHETFFPIWQRYQRVLKQRNDALRRAKMGGGRELLDPWDEQLIALGADLDLLRRTQLEHLVDAFEAVTSDLQGLFSSDGVLLPPLKLEYSNGFGRHPSLREAIERERDGDCRAGVTRYGPHRADLLFTCGKRPASEILSRGQLKTLVSALVIAQLRLLKALNPLSTVWCLLDDLPAELDEAHRRAVIRCLLDEQPGVQLFLTSIEKTGFKDDFIDEHYALFHVKQGKVEQEQ